MPKRDINEEAVRQVNELTNSEPVNGEDLIESEELKRQLAGANTNARVARGFRRV